MIRSGFVLSVVFSITLLGYYMPLNNQNSFQSARRGAKSALISAHLAGGDCLNVGCVPVSTLAFCLFEFTT